MAIPNPIEKPLTGVRVLDCTRVLSGPICSRTLSDMGADVVKIEAPEADILRSTPPHVSGLATMFSQYNVGKRNVSIDLKHAEGPKLLADLAAEADVFLENFRPGVLERLGLGADTLRAANPRLIFCSITGWGQTGPWASRPAYAPIVQAEAGTLAMGGALRRGPMRGETMQHADLYAGMMASQAILSALFHRERTGKGQRLDIAMGEALLYVNEHASAEIAGYDGSRGFETWDFETFTLGDGRSVHIMGKPEQLFPLLVQKLPIEGAMQDPRFATSEARGEHRQELVALLSRELAALPNQAALEELLAGTPVVVIGVRTTRELAESDWAAQRGLLTEVAPGLSVPTAPWRSMDLAIGPANAHIAKRGEHNRDVLTEWLDLDEEGCSALERKGVIEFSADEPPTLDQAPRKAFREPKD